MKVLIFSGGTGSRAIQKGLYHMYGNMIETTVVTNAYDNGLSTGVVRKVMKGKVLGPSDLRKNQLFQLELRFNELSDEQKNILKFLNSRISADTSIEMMNLIIERLDALRGLPEHFYNLLKSSIISFFDEEDSSLFSYNDFSISNIIYGGLARKNGYSLERAGEIMESFLKLPTDKVILSSDDSLFLQGLTENGKIIWDEGDIVQWSNTENLITGIRLVDNKGKERVPELTDKVKNKIKEADIIIFSSGTQWSSLIPTYVHKEFKSFIEKSKAKKYLIMNNVPDLDMTGIDSIGVLNILDDYLPLKDITVVYNESADKSMCIIHNDYESLIDNFIDESTFDNSVHDGYSLIKTIVADYFKNYVKNDYYVFDFDGTVVGRGESFIDESNYNIFSLEKFPKNKTTILSGNSLNHINKKLKGNFVSNFIYCDGGNSYCEWDNKLKKYVFKRYVDPDYVMSLKEIEMLYNKLIDLDVPVYKIENRNDMIISVKPLSPVRRKEIQEKMIKLVGKDYEILLNGRTTVDIYKKGYNKSVVFNDPKFKDKNIFYAGDELESGNDAPIRKIKNINFFPVKDPRDTTAFIKTMIEK